MSDAKITDQNNEFKYFTQVSNIIDELDLSPLAIALYFHFKRWANAKHKQIVSVRDLMKKYKCGSQAIKLAKLELVANDLITIDDTQNRLGIPDDIQIIDIIHRNYEYFKPSKPVTGQAHPSLSSDSTRHQPVTAPVTIQEQHPSLDSDAIRNK
jgi:hypothetical protein